MTFTNSSVVTEIPLGFPGTLFRSPMPFGPYDPLSEIWPAYQANEVDLVVVLTEPQEYLVHAKRDLPAFYKAAGLEVISLPVPDFDSPKDESEFERVLDDVRIALKGGRHVAVHCMAGIGRTGVFLACLAKRILGLDGRSAIEFVRQHVPTALEMSRQEQFVEAF